MPEEMFEVVLKAPSSMITHLDGIEARLKLQSRGELFSLALALFAYIDGEVRYRKATFHIRYPDGTDSDIE